MPAAEQILVTLPPDVLEIVRSRMKAGSFANESEVIADAIVETVLPPINALDLDEWIRTEGVRRYDAMRADPSRALTEKQVFAGLCVEEE